MKRIFLTVIAVLSCVGAFCQQRVIEIDSPSMRVYLPDPATATGRAVVACPGGGYTHLATDHEGYDWAPFFNKQGIALAVVKYRFPKGDHTIPIADATAAVKIMRDSAATWGLNPRDIGIMGSSAGGHLASTVATHAAPGERPDFQILFYPVITMDKSFTHIGSHDNLLGKDATPEMELLFSNEKQVTSDTPPAFIVFSDDDDVVPPMNGVKYYAALHNNGVPAVIHIYPSGGHGWGIREGFRYKAEMQADLIAWLNSFKAPACCGKACKD